MRRRSLLRLFDEVIPVGRLSNCLKTESRGLAHARGHSQVLLGFSYPTCPVLNDIVIEVPQGDLRSHACIVCAVRVAEHVWRPFVRFVSIRTHKSLSNFRRSRPFTFVCEKRNF